MEQPTIQPYVPSRKPVPSQEFQNQIIVPDAEPIPKEQLYIEEYEDQKHQPNPRVRSQQSFFARNRKWILIAIAVTVVAIIAIGAGVGASKKHRSSSSGSSSGDSSDCTPPGGMMCESSGDCQQISDFSQCLTACDGFSYCT